MYERLRDLVKRNVAPFQHIFEADYVLNAFLMVFTHLRTQPGRSMDTASWLMNDMDTRGQDPAERIVRPTARTWTIYMHGYTVRGEMQAAERVLETMRERGLAPLQTTWEELIYGYARKSKAREAMDALDRMQADGFTPDRLTSEALSRLNLPIIHRTGWQGFEGREQDGLIARG